MLYGLVLEELRIKTEENQSKIREKDEKETQKDLAALIGVDSSVYGKYEREAEIIPLKHLNILCNHFNVSLDYIFGFTKEKQYNNSKQDISKVIVGNNLKSIRKELKKTQQQFAELSSVSYGAISGFERGRYLVSTKVLYDICKKYKISADYLLGKIDEPKYLK